MLRRNVRPEFSAVPKDGYLSFTTLNEQRPHTGTATNSVSPLKRRSFRLNQAKKQRQSSEVGDGGHRRWQAFSGVKPA